MEATEERRTFRKLVDKLKWLGDTLKLSFEFGGVDANSLNKMKDIVEGLNNIVEPKEYLSSFINDWLCLPEFRPILESWIKQVRNLFDYHRCENTIRVKPEQIGKEYVEFTEVYEAWRCTLLLYLAKYLKDGEMVDCDGNIYLKGTDSIKEKEGKPTFKDNLLVQDKDGLLERLHKYLDVDGRKGKDAAMIIKVCCDNGLMTKPETPVIVNEFNIGSRQGFDNQWKIKECFEKDRLRVIENFLKDFM